MSRVRCCRLFLTGWMLLFCHALLVAPVPESQEYLLRKNLPGRSSVTASGDLMGAAGGEWRGDQQ
jgi:hypothetical protein